MQFLHLRALLLLLASAALSGCVAGGKKLADKKTAPAVALNLTNGLDGVTPPFGPMPSAQRAADPASPSVPASPLAITVRSVIVYKGPGSWKNEAYWDEYAVTLANPGATSLVIVAPELYDASDHPAHPGENPWKLESVSKKLLADTALQVDKPGTLVVAGAGAVATTALLANGVASLASTAAYVGAGSVAVAALPVAIVAAVVYDSKSKHVVEAEFNRRRLVFPLTIASGQTVQGSLFFPITPSPHRLAFRYNASGPDLETAVDLAPLAGLHVGKKTTAIPAWPLPKIPSAPL